MSQQTFVLSACNRRGPSFLKHDFAMWVIPGCSGVFVDPAFLHAFAIQAARGLDRFATPRDKSMHMAQLKEMYCDGAFLEIFLCLCKTTWRREALAERTWIQKIFSV